jgi:hypothetical protein
MGQGNRSRPIGPEALGGPGIGGVSNESYNALSDNETTFCTSEEPVGATTGVPARIIHQDSVVVVHASESNIRVPHHRFTEFFPGSKVHYWRAVRIL